MSSVERAPDAPRDDLNARASALAQEISTQLADGRFDAVAPEVIQALAAAVCKTYAAAQEAGDVYPILSRQDNVTGTDVMVACSALLKAADLQVFELGMWSSWTGR